MTRRLHPYPASAEILEKLESKHGVHWGEIEEFFGRYVKILRTHRKDQYGEPRYLGLGRTESGRYLIVFFVGVPPDQAKVISARDMTEKERNIFRKK